MCIMGNGNDPPARIPSWNFSDEKHESNKKWPQHAINCLAFSYAIDSECEFYAYS